MAFAEPVENIKNLSIGEGYKVADFGAGSGHYALAVAARVRNSGQVFAVDVQKDLLSKLQSTAREKGFRNIEVVWGDLDKPKGSKLRDSMVDAVIVSNILFQSAHKDEVAKEAFRILKPAGEVMVIDWSDSWGNLGPTPESIVSEDEAKTVFESAGFKFGRSFPAGDHHYGMILTK